MSLNDIMQQAQAMQEKMQQAQEEIANLKVEGESENGLVKLILTGKNECIRVMINPDLLQGDAQHLEQLIMSAYNNAQGKVTQAKQEKTQSMTGGINLPPGFNLPL